MIPTILLTLIPSTLWGLSTLLEKYYLLNKFTPSELMLLRPPFVLLITLVYLYYNKNTFKKFITADRNTLIIFFATLLFGLTAIIVYWSLLKKKRATWVSTCVTPLTLIMTILIATIFFKEKVKKMEWLGIIFVFIGLFCIHFGDKK